MFFGPRSFLSFFSTFSPPGFLFYFFQVKNPAQRDGVFRKTNLTKDFVLLQKKIQYSNEESCLAQEIGNCTYSLDNLGTGLKYLSQVAYLIWVLKGFFGKFWWIWLFKDALGKKSTWIKQTMFFEMDGTAICLIIR